MCTCSNQVQPTRRTCMAHVHVIRAGNVDCVAGPVGSVTLVLHERGQRRPFAV